MLHRLWPQHADMDDLYVAGAQCTHPLAVGMTAHLVLLLIRRTSTKRAAGRTILCPTMTMSPSSRRSGRHSRPSARRQFAFDGLGKEVCQRLGGAAAGRSSSCRNS